MNPLELLIKIIQNPEASKYYRDLKDYYSSQNKLHESNSVNYLIEQIFDKNEK